MSNPMYKGIPPYTGAWADCAYDPETPGPIYHPDQIKVESELQDVLRNFTKAVLKEPSVGSYDELIEFSRQYFVKASGSSGEATS